MNNITMTQAPVLGVYSCQSRHCTGNGTNLFCTPYPPTARLQLTPTTSLSPCCLCNISCLSNFMVFWRPMPSFIGWVLKVGFSVLSSGWGTQTFSHTRCYHIFPKAFQAGLKPGLIMNVWLQHK